MTDPARAADDFRRIIVICTRQIGDVLLTTPLIAAAKARWPNAAIDVLGFGGTLGMLRGNPDVAALIEVPAGSRWLALRLLIRRIWRRYDLALIAQFSDRAHLYGFAAAPVRAGLVPQTRSHGWWKRLLLQHAVTVESDSGRHVSDEKVALLAPWLSAATPAVVSPRPTPLPDDLLRSMGTLPVVVHAPSMWRYKQWPVGHYERVIGALRLDGHRVVLTGSSAARDRAMVAAIAAAAAGDPGVIDASGRLDFGELASLFARAALYIGPDTSVTHLAAASGVPVIALFGPTDPTRWAPRGSDATATPFVRVGEERRQQRGQVVLLQGPGACVPCGRAGCADSNDSTSECLEAIGPERVIAEARRLLGAAATAVRGGSGVSRATAAGA
ncbi:MAG: glycosyltransferase family 9 protein [Caldimonas sp.]